MNMEHLWNDNDRENRSTREKTCPYLILYINLTWTYQTWNPPPPPEVREE
jgi:hypothetical protein